MSIPPRYILTLSCKDVMGIVAKVSGFLFEHKGFIIESHQFGDESTGMFFMRSLFESRNPNYNYDEWKKTFTPIAEHFGMDWKLRDMNTKQNVLMMVSKQGHCLNDLLHRYISNEEMNVNVVGVLSNHRDLERMATWYDIPFYYLPVTHETKMEQEAEVYRIIKAHHVDLVVLARYMQILSSALCAKLRGKAINIHHSFLPSFKGARPYHQAYDRGVKQIGATAHYVTDDLDEGPIIVQDVVGVDHTQTPKDLIAIGQDIESIVLAKAVKYHLEDRVLVNGTKTVVFK